MYHQAPTRGRCSSSRPRWTRRRSSSTCDRSPAWVRRAVSELGRLRRVHPPLFEGGIAVYRSSCRGVLAYAKRMTKTGIRISGYLLSIILYFTVSCGLVRPVPDCHMSPSRLTPHVCLSRDLSAPVLSAHTALRGPGARPTTRERQRATEPLARRSRYTLVRAALTRLRVSARARAAY